MLACMESTVTRFGSFFFVFFPLFIPEISASHVFFESFISFYYFSHFLSLLNQNFRFFFSRFSFCFLDHSARYSSCSLSSCSCRVTSLPLSLIFYKSMLVTFNIQRLKRKRYKLGAPRHSRSSNRSRCHRTEKQPEQRCHHYYKPCCLV